MGNSNRHDGRTAELRRVDSDQTVWNAHSATANDSTSTISTLKSHQHLSTSDRAALRDSIRSMVGQNDCEDRQEQVAEMFGVTHAVVKSCLVDDRISVTIHLLPYGIETTAVCSRDERLPDLWATIFDAIKHELHDIATTADLLSIQFGGLQFEDEDTLAMHNAENGAQLRVLLDEEAIQLRAEEIEFAQFRSPQGAWGAGDVGVQAADPSNENVDVGPPGAVVSDREALRALQDVLIQAHVKGFSVNDLAVRRQVEVQAHAIAEARAVGWDLNALATQEWVLGRAHVLYQRFHTARPAQLTAAGILVVDSTDVAHLVWRSY